MMNIKGARIGLAVTGSHCTIKEVLTQAERMASSGALLYPIISHSVDKAVTRFGSSSEVKSRLKNISGRQIIATIIDAEPIGPGKLLDVLVVAPCTGNTLAKLANGITDTPVLMSIKAQLRNTRPVLLAVATNDGLGLNAKNIGTLLSTKNIYLVPFGQDDPENKPNSIVSDFKMILPATEKALEGEQLQPLLLSYSTATFV